LKISEDTQVHAYKKDLSRKSRLRVLHVDNDSYILEVSKKILELDGRFEVDSALSVDEAIAKLKKQTYQVIVSDYEMPRENGLEFLQRLKKEPKDIPFIIFTGKGREEVVIKALNLGAFRYVNKHGDTETVYTELATSINQAAQQAKSLVLLKESEERYHTLFSLTKEGIALHEVLYDTQGKPENYIILDVNPAHESIMGIKKKDAIGKKATELYGTPEPPYLDIYAKTAETGEYQRFETFFAPMNRYFNINVFSPSKDKFATIFVDITQIKEKEIALRDSLYALAEKEERWSTTLSSIGDAVIATDVAGRITFMNSRAETLTGWQLLDAEKKPLSEVFKIINEYTRKEVENPVEKVLKGKIIVGLANHTLLLRKDGSEIPIDDSGAPIKNELGKITGVVLVFRDITDRKRAENILTQEEERFEKAFQASPIAMAISQFSDGCFVDVNESLLHLLEYSREEAIGHTSIDLKVFSSLKDRNEYTRTIIEKGSIQNFEIIVTTKTGKLINVILSSEKFNFNGQDFLLTTAIDITRLRHNEEQLRRLNRHLRAISNSNQVLMHTSDEHKYLREVCNIVVNDCGYASAWVGFIQQDKNKTIKLVTYAGFKKNDTNQIKDLWDDKLIINNDLAETVIRNGEPQVYKDIQQDQNYTLWFKQVVKKGITGSCALPIKSSEGKIFGVLSIYSKDSNPFSNEEIRLLKELAEDFAQGIMTLRLQVAKEQAENKLRESEEKFRILAEESPNMIFINRKGRVVYANKTCEQKMGYKREEFYASNFSFLSLIAPESINLLQEVYTKHLRGEEVAPYEYKLITKEGNIIEAEINSKLICYEGETSIIGVITDITDRKKAEETLRKSKINLQMMNEKLRVVGGLSRHDVRNKLSIIIGNAYLLKVNTDQPEALDKIDKINNSIKEINKILEFTKIYEQLGVEELSLIDVGKSLDEVKTLFPDSKIEIINNCRGLMVLADSLIKQLFYNLIDNTIKHGRKATTINVYYEHKDPNELELIFEDNGIGISTENKKQLYKAGFSTGSSTGYGLYLTKKMIDIYGWKIQESGESEKGAKFIISIPKRNKTEK
jgi:PAS domain S-box-containing protein